MKRKNLNVLFIAITVLGMLVVWLFFSRESKYLGTSAFRAVHVDSPLFAKILDICSFSSEIAESPMWEELSSLPGLGEVYSNVKLIDSLISVNGSIEKILRKKSLTLSVGVEGEKDFSVLYILELDGISERGDIKTFFEEMFSGNDIAASKREYEKATIFSYEWTDGNRREHLSYTTHKGLLLFSKSPIRVDEAIRQLNAKMTLFDNENFNVVHKTAGAKANINLYLNHESFSHLLSLCVNRSRAKKTMNFSNYASWTEIDVTLRPREVMLNGFTFSSGYSNSYMNVFLSQTPRKFTIESVLPATTSFFLSLNLSNPKMWFDSYDAFLGEDRKSYNYEERVSRFKKHTKTDPREFIIDNVDGEVGIAFCHDSSIKHGEGRFFIVKTKSGQKAEESLNEVLEKSKDKNIDKLTIDKASFDVYKFPVHNFGEVVFGPIFHAVSTEYVAFCNNYMVFGDSFNSLSYFIRSNALSHEVLENDTTYRKFNRQFSQASNFYLWCVPGHSFSFLKEFLDDGVVKQVEKNIESLRKVEAVGWQMGKGKEGEGMVYNNALIRYNPDMREKPQAVWRSHLGNQIEFKPQFTINHNDRANREVMVQDADYKLYLISKIGKVQWSPIKLNEPILSKIYQIDYYKNGKLQYFFNTPNALHLIDRNGNYVENYPIKLREKSTNGVAVFDYDNSKNYRFCVACSDKKVYMYDKRGKLLPGWGFGKTEHTVSRPIQHHRVGSKDYIVFFDLNRTYILDRKGNERVRTKASFTHSMSNDFTFEKGNGPGASRLVKTDSKGDIYFLYFDGSFEKKKMPKFGSGHYFRYEDINADGERDLIYIDKDMLSVFRHNGKKLYDKKFSSPISLPMQVYTFPGVKRRIGVVNKEEQRIYLFSSDGSQYKGFPLDGCSEFSIGDLGSRSHRFNLIVGSSDGFLYNYAVK